MDLRRRLRGPAARRGIIAAGVLLLVHGLAAGSLALLQEANAEVVLPGTVVAGVPVGGLERTQLRTAVEARTTELLDGPVRVTVADEAGTAGAGPAPGHSDGIDVMAVTAPDAQGVADGTELTVETDRRSTGMSTDAEAASDDAWARGRRGLWRALFDQLRARAARPIEVAVPLDLDPERADRWSTSTAEQLTVEPRPAQIELLSVAPPDATRIETTPARTGARVSADELRDELESGYADTGLLEIRTSREPVPPATTAADVEAAVAAAELALSAPVTLRNPTPGADVELAPTDLASILGVELEPDAPEGERLRLVADPRAFRDHLGEQVRAIERDPDEARIELDEGRAEVVGGTPGFSMDLPSAAEQVRSTSQRTSEREAPLPGTVLEPAATPAEVRRALMASGLDVGTPVVLENGGDGDDLELSPEQLTALLEVGFEPGADADEALTVSVDGDRLLEVLGDRVDAVETEPTEPRFSVSGDEVTIEEGAAGRTLDAEVTAQRVAELATEPDPRRAPLPLVRQDPELTLEEARGLGIDEEVSSFTTSMVAGQARNLNIRQAADYLDGSLVLPGERLSLNDAIGRRTTDRGFGEGGFIRDGEIVEVVGGGVSQMATTFMNAAWFAGVELVEFQPHSLYFSQYPVGRESTMSGNTLDVVVENDSPYGILVTTDHSDTHVTVSFWSTEWAEVDTWTGEPTNRVPGELRDGFDVRFGRTITYPDGTSRDESYAHRYQPENAP
jgi:vancomycin resistance protein YoaR